MKEEKLIKEFFAHEVEQQKIPPMKIRKVKWDSLFMAACIFGCFSVLLLPSAYDNVLRRSYVPMSKYEAFKEEFPRVIFDASLYFKNK